MPFSNDWTVVDNPADHSKFKNLPGAVRDVRTDVEERLADMLYGFTSGETNVGVKYLQFKDQAGNPGTPDAGYLRFFAKTVTGVLGFYFKNAAGTVYQVITGLGGALAGVLDEFAGADIASAGTTDIAAATGNYVHITGTTTITALGTAQAGAMRETRFTGVLLLTHNAVSMILLTGANITTAAGDIARWRSLGGGNWRMVSYERADGSPLAIAAATQADQETGTSLVKAVTPGAQQYHPSSPKAWACFTPSTAGLKESYKVTSITRNSSGSYRVNLGVTMSGTGYCVQFRGNYTGSIAYDVTKATTYFDLLTHNLNYVAIEADELDFVVYGDLA